MAGNNSLFVIIGPTASGKSELAMELARRLDGEILSVDSMQVYKQLDIGTAKPMQAERAEVVHHLIDVVEPDELFTAARFVELADATIADTSGRAKPLVATGGTPLYYKVLFQGIFDGPSGSDDIRARLKAESNDVLHRRLVEVDAAAAARIHVNDTRRLLRALEVFEMTGQPISAMQTEWAASTHRHPAKWFGLSWEKEALNRRINARVRAMIEAGWVDEVRGLLDRFGELSKTAGEATGYRELIAHVRGQMSLDDAIEQIKIGTRQLARRQMKWFRRFPNVTWLAAEMSLEQKLSAIIKC